MGDADRDAGPPAAPEAWPEAWPGAAPVTSPATPPPGPSWGLVEPVLTFFLGIFGAIVVGLVAAAATGRLGTGGEGLDEVSLPTTLGSLGGLWVVYACGVWFASRSRGSGNVVRDLGLRFDGWGDVLLGVAVGAASWVGVGILYQIVRLVGLLDADDAARLDDRARALADAARGPSFVVMALAIGVGAPLFEEIFFRGFLQPPLARRVRPLAGVVLTAAVFALAHGRLLEVAGLFAFGLVLGWLAQSTGRLGPSIVAHAVFNGMTLAVLAAATG